MTRLDVWLNVACIYKTRSQAACAIRAGHVKIPTRAVRPATPIKAGDRIHVTLPGLERELEIIEVASKPVPKDVARTLYEEIERKTTETREHRMWLRRRRLEAHRAGHEKIKGRPTKKERRRLDRLRDR